jgi:hypothetical protein
MFTIILLFLFCNFSLAAEPKLVSKLNSAFSEIEKWLIKLSTPAAAVAVGTGIFMRKFSFGDEERIRTGKKLIRGSLFSYAFILGIDLVLAAIKGLVG